MLNYSIIVDCPDEYLDILNIFFFFLEKNWKNRTQTIYVTTQESEIEHPDNVIFVKCGNKANSIQRALNALQLINDEYVLILNSDDFIGKKINDEIIDQLLQYAINNDIKYVRVWKSKNREQKKYKTKLKGLYYCNKKARYSKSLMANFWKKEEFLNLFKGNSIDGWTIEGEWLKDTLLESPGYYDSYCYCSVNPFNIVHAVSKGKWIRKAYRFCVKNKVSKELLSYRQKLSLKDTFKANISNYLSNNFSSSTCYKLKKLTSKFVKYTNKF